MKEKMLDDFIQYAKEQFGYDIIIEKVSEPDTFKSVFGVSFLEQDAEMFSMEEGKNALEYTNDCIIVPLNFVDETEDCFSAWDMELAA